MCHRSIERPPILLDEAKHRIVDAQSAAAELHVRRVLAATAEKAGIEETLDLGCQNQTDLALTEQPMQTPHLIACPVVGAESGGPASKEGRVALDGAFCRHSMGDEFELAQYYLKQPSDAALVMKAPRAATHPDRERHPRPVEPHFVRLCAGRHAAGLAQPVARFGRIMGFLS